MKSLRQMLSFQWDLFRERFTCHIVESEEDRNACIKILEAVRRKELNRVAGKSVLDSHAFSGKELNYQLMACRDTHSDQIIGCMRITNAMELKAIPDSFNEYHLDLFSDDLLEGLAVFTRLAVLKSHRKTPAALVLMSSAFDDFVQRGGQAVLLSCEPNLYTMYKRLGMRPIGGAHNSPSGGYRIPMIFLPDIPYLKQIKSPALQTFQLKNKKQVQPILDWYEKRREVFANLRYEVTPFHLEQGDIRLDDYLTMGMSKKSRKEFLQNAIIIKCRKGDVIAADQDGGKFIGVVRRGKIKVEKDGWKIGELREGDVFGEVAFVLNARRTANLISTAKNTEVLLFSVSAIKRISKTKDRVIVWENLAKILAERLVQRTEYLIL